MITPEARVSYPHLFVAHAPKPGDKKKFSFTGLFPKNSDLMGLTGPGGKPISIKQVIINAKIAEFGPDKKSWPKDLESPVTDGDDPKHADKEGYPGHWVIKFSTGEDQRPAVVDRKGRAIENPGDVYPGCYGRAYVYAYVYHWPDRQKPMKKGITFILEHFQKTNEGKSFAGKKPVEQVFAPIEDDDSDVNIDEMEDF